MIIPVRCFTCHKVLGDKWEYYDRRVNEEKDKREKSEYIMKDLKIDDKKTVFFSDDYKGKILNELNIDKICCRRHMLGHVDLINVL
jgi:DNA-directed RNA polymerase subunit N